MLGTAIAVVLGLGSADASAFALGQLKVQSALGEPLRAEIEVTEMAAAEAENLKIGVASAEAFKNAGVPYNAALSDVRATLQRRAGGQYVVRLTGSRPLNDPFIDLLLEANGASGRIVRDYTVLLDPPTSRQAAPAAPIAPVPPQVRASVERPEVLAARARRERALAAPAAPATAPAPTATPPAAAPQRAAATPPRATGGEQLTVQRGDTAGRIAAAHKPAEVSLDQMLVALLRANPDAFIGGNVNRMKAGAVLDLPSATEAGATPAAEARRTIVAQSRDFGAYRQRLAENAPTSNVAAADRSASGRLQASVEDRNAAASAPDKLTITQNSAAARAAEEKVAQARQAQENSNRVAELSKNIEELAKLKAATGSVTPPAGSAPAAGSAPVAGSPAAPAAPGIPVPNPGVTAPATAAAPATPPTAATPAAETPAAVATPGAPGTAAPEATVGTPSTAETTPGAPAATASAAAPAPVAAPKPVVKAAPPPPPPERGFFEELLANPLMLAGAALVALLVGFLLYRVLGRRREEMSESVFLESRIPKDSFFGASGGESVDTKQRGDSTVSSLSYSPSQLDAGDVDPVAEADVYLAYGRDLQAEEILREALRVNPERTAIHLKLLEIHAKRRDVRAYEGLATEVHKLTNGTGTDWNRVVDMGKDLDPGNPLYDAGSTARGVSPAEGAAFAGALAAAAAAKPAAPVPAPAPAPAVSAPPAFVPSVAPLDFDLDLSQPAALSAVPAPAPAPAPVSASLPKSAYAAPTPVAPLGNGHAAAQPPIAPADMENDFDTAPGALAPITRPGALGEVDPNTRPVGLRSALPADSGFIEFDMSALAGLPSRPADSSNAATGATLRAEPSLDEDDEESPHAVKLSLARELQAIGDVEGARSLVEEVEAESAGDVQSQARQLLAELR
jgi:pilus assembly protein FimV